MLGRRSDPTQLLLPLPAAAPGAAEHTEGGEAGRGWIPQGRIPLPLESAWRGASPLAGPFPGCFEGLGGYKRSWCSSPILISILISIPIPILSKPPFHEDFRVVSPLWQSTRSCIRLHHLGRCRRMWEAFPNPAPALGKGKGREGPHSGVRVAPCDPTDALPIGMQRDSVMLQEKMILQDNVMLQANIQPSLDPKPIPSLSSGGRMGAGAAPTPRPPISVPSPGRTRGKGGCLCRGCPD